MTDGPVTDAVHAHCAMLASLARGLDGVFVLAGYGEDPRTGATLEPRVEHIEAQEVRGRNAADRLYGRALGMAEDPGRNVYAAASLMRPGIGAGRKGGEQDVAHVLALVTDFDAKDDPRAGEYADRLPLAPNLVVETSPGSFQCWYCLDEPATLEAAKPVARSLVDSAGCDPTAKDLSHVWRIPGLPNWPSRKKVEAGRDPEPFTARVVSG